MSDRPTRHRLRPGTYLAAVAVLALSVACGGAGPIVQVNTSPVAPPSPVASVSISPVAALSCTPVATVAPYDPASQDAQHVADGQAPALTSYASMPPASGPHAAYTMPAGVYDQPVPWENVVHSMEHGAAVIWYDPAADPTRIAAVRAIIETDPQHVIMAPYSFPDEGEAGALPDGTEMALVAWRRLQTCEALDANTVREFLSSYRTPPLGGGTYLGEAPEPGVQI